MLGRSMTVMVNVLQVLKSPSLPKNALEEAWFLLYASISRARPSLWPGSFSFVPSRLVDRVILMPAYRELKPHFIDKSRMIENNKRDSDTFAVMTGDRKKLFQSEGTLDM